MYFATGCHYRYPATGVFQLANVPRPVETGQEGLCIGEQLLWLHAQFIRSTGKEVPHQLRYVFAPL